MSLDITYNLAAAQAQQALTTTLGAQQTASQRLSTGLRVNSSADDAAGLAVAERVLVQIRAMNMNIRNAGDAISLLQIADGGASQISANLQRMRELAIQAANGVYLPQDRANLNVEFVSMAQEIDRLAKTVSFNSLLLLNNSGTFTFQVGTDASVNSKIQIGTANLLGSALGIYAFSNAALGAPGQTFNIAWQDGGGLLLWSNVAGISNVTGAANVTGFSNVVGWSNGSIVTLGQLADLWGMSNGSSIEDMVLAISGGSLVSGWTSIGGMSLADFDPYISGNLSTVLDAIDTAINTITTTRAGFGAGMNRTEAVISFLNLSVMNQSTARGRIMDADYAAESSNLSSAQILQQAGTAMLAQANQSQQNVLTLLR